MVGLGLWVLGCAAINRPSGVDGYWFLDQLHAEMGKIGVETYDDFEQICRILIVDS